MNEDTLIEETLREWAHEARVPADLAGRALRAHARRRFGRAGMGAALLAAIIGFVTLVPAASPGGPTTVEDPAPPRVSVDTVNNPPRTLVAAGPWAIGSYYTTKFVPAREGTETLRYTWWVYSSGQGRYVRTDWQWVDVYPGMRHAAVLEGELPTTSVAVYDLVTMLPIRRFTLEMGAAAVYWSPDGGKLVATVYTGPPDEVPARADVNWPAPSRGGFMTIDVATETSTWTPAVDTGLFRRRSDFRFDADDTRVWAYDEPVATRLGNPDVGEIVDIRPYSGPPLRPSNSPPPRVRAYYGVQGGLPEEREGPMVDEWGRTPEGDLVSGGSVVPPEVAARLPDVAAAARLRLLAWVDDDHVIGIGCADACAREVDNTMFMISLDGRERVQLTFRESQHPFTPVLVRR
uniref:hypothetical protein n=1 Tax=Herbidospora sakaeratensis TaxID=564415 RepID=UPI00078597DC|nr:hypothetical protein [Herbidospora sakaeratensis]